MKKFACQYAVIRFLPYLETGEFANVGIVLLCPETGYFDFRLLTRVRRITAFFEELNANIYRDTQKNFQQELKRIKQFIDTENKQGKLTKDLVNHIFGELTRAREVMMRFDEVRTILTDDPTQHLEELFCYYVERNFANTVYQERLLENEVRNVLRAADLIGQFKPQTLGDQNAYHAKFPFVYMEGDRAIKAIKPLNLAHDDPAQIFDHGWAWMGKIQQLRAMNLLQADVLLPVKRPDMATGPQAQMFTEVFELLAKQNIQVVDANDANKILEFANH
ncbi:DUF3037 domain-containing protein [Methyloradius palustris]|uniref:DUF3037 domain-containing protein n=1 Tax=Methyloradius palustris TaxID=2778876 RepID=A0A8D5G1J6_9PROT|nr:DUF3037 domain-containing protein [Methyloradius palustris]BCM26269.1 hypothetical protein ZMTM_25280 [Methyloradius palustris]